MNYELNTNVSSPILKVILNNNQAVSFERGAMVYKTELISLESSRNSSIFNVLSRGFVNGDVLQLPSSISLSDNQYIGLAPSIVGDILVLSIGENQLFLNQDTFLACDTTVSLTVNRIPGLSIVVLGSNASLFNLKTSGVGDIAIYGFGNIIKIDVNNESLSFDNSHVLAWDTSLDYKAVPSSSSSGLKTGESLFLDFKGSGSVYIQTRQLPDFSEKIMKYSK